MSTFINKRNFSFFMFNKENLEKLEKKCLDFVWQSLPKDQNFYHEIFSQLSFDELYSFLSRQKKGRAKTRYLHELSELIENMSSLTKEMELELRSRVAASSIFSKAFERNTNASLIKSFFSNNIKFTLNYSPNSSNFSAFLELNDFSPEIRDDEIDGVLLNVDTNSINGYSNLSDALYANYFGRFNIGLNQITYQPPKLRDAIQKGKKLHLNQKYRTLNGYKKWRGKSYIVITIFVTILSCLPNKTFFYDEFKKIGGNYFDHYIMCTCAPHVFLTSDYYDNYFGPGKGGKEKGYPKDYRFIVYNESSKFLKFENLNEIKYRFKIVNKNGTYSSNEYSKGNFFEKTFIISNPEN